MNPARFSLRKREILRGYKVFSRVIAEGQSFQRGVVRCFVARTAEPGGSLQAGFSVSRSVRNAADRNRARRWMKESYRKNKVVFTAEPLPATEGLMVVFLCTAQVRSIHNGSARISVERSMIALVKDLHSQFIGKP